MSKEQQEKALELLREGKAKSICDALQKAGYSHNYINNVAQEAHNFRMRLGQAQLSWIDKYQKSAENDNKNTPEATAKRISDLIEFGENSDQAKDKMVEIAAIREHTRIITRLVGSQTTPLMQIAKATFNVPQLPDKWQESSVQDAEIVDSENPE